jgi:hypothetical protein
MALVGMAAGLNVRHGANQLAFLIGLPARAPVLDERPAKYPDLEITIRFLRRFAD